MLTGAMAAALAVWLFPPESITAQECYTPRCLQRTNCARWPTGQAVTVYINETQLNPIEQAAVREAFVNWQSATQHLIGVTFNFVNVTSPPPPGQINYHYVGRGTRVGGAVSNIGWTQTPSNGAIVQHVSTEIGTAHTTDTIDTPEGRHHYDQIITHMAHEIGHPFGLDDEY